MFVVFAPLAGFVLERIRARWIVSGMMGTLVLLAWVIILINVNKPILSSMSIFYPQDREFLHFIREEAAQSLYLDYGTIANALKKMGCKNIGLIMGQGEAEYLLWVALNPSAGSSMRIESILVDNASANLKYPLGDFVPDAVISINDDRTVVNWANHVYQVVWHNEIPIRKISILLRRT